MTQFYIGFKQILAWESEQDGQAGYSVQYDDGYQSWSPKDTFERAYFPMGEDEPDAINEKMVTDFIVDYTDSRIGDHTTMVTATLRNGMFVTQTTGCVDPVNYDHDIGKAICIDKIRSQVWEMLGFALMWARNGVQKLG